MYEKQFVVGTNLSRALVGRSKRSESGMKTQKTSFLTASPRQFNMRYAHVTGKRPVTIAENKAAV